MSLCRWCEPGLMSHNEASEWTRLVSEECTRLLEIIPDSNLFKIKQVSTNITQMQLDEGT